MLCCILLMQKELHIHPCTFKITHRVKHHIHNFLRKVTHSSYLHNSDCRAKEILWSCFPIFSCMNLLYPSSWAGCDTRLIYEWSLTGLNSEFSFSLIGCHTKIMRSVCPTIYHNWKEVIYKALCFDVAQGRMNGAPNETRTHSCRFASLAC